MTTQADRLRTGLTIRRALSDAATPPLPPPQLIEHQSTVIDIALKGFASKRTENAPKNMRRATNQAIRILKQAQKDKTADVLLLCERAKVKPEEVTWVTALTWLIMRFKEYGELATASVKGLLSRQDNARYLSTLMPGMVLGVPNMLKLTDLRYVSEDSKPVIESMLEICTAADFDSETGRMWVQRLANCFFSNDEARSMRRLEELEEMARDHFLAVASITLAASITTV